jgi:hypothetical protein
MPRFALLSTAAHVWLAQQLHCSVCMVHVKLQTPNKTLLLSPASSIHIIQECMRKPPALLGYCLCLAGSSSCIAASAWHSQSRNRLTRHCCCSLQASSLKKLASSLAS